MQVSFRHPVACGQALSSLDLRRSVRVNRWQIWLRVWLRETSCIGIPGKRRPLSLHKALWIYEFHDMPFGHTNVPLCDTIKDVLVSHTPHVDINLLVPQGSSLAWSSVQRTTVHGNDTSSLQEQLWDSVRGWLNLQTPDYIDLSEVFINDILVSVSD